MNLLTIRDNLPALYSTEGELDPLVQLKFFTTPDSNWTWYVLKGGPI